MTVGLPLGLCEGEMLGRKWSDVDLDRRKLHVRRQAQYLHGAWHFVEPKSEAGHRTLSIPAPIGEELKAHRVRVLEMRLAAGDKCQDHDLVFPSLRGTPIGASNLDRRFKARLVEAGLPPMKTHDLRHAGVTLMLAQGVPLAIVSKRVGHSQVSITAYPYGHLTDEMAEDAAERMAPVFEQNARRS